MKPESQFPKLPSLSELLQHPTVEKVVERVNQSTIAQRATGFLAELQTSLREKADQGVVPSLNQLAERLAQRLLGQAAHALPIINATGEICSPRWQAPLADVAVQEMLRVAGEFHESTNTHQQQAGALLCSLTGAESAWVVNHYRAAKRLVQECPDVSAEFAGYAGLFDPAKFGLLPVRSLASYVESGADVVVCDGAGLLGGPSCGILFGRSEAIEKLQQHAWAESIAAEVLPLVALVATLSVYREQSQVMHQIPVWQLLSAPLENLQQRAERLAPLIAACDPIAAAEPTPCESAWCHTEQMRLAGPTWAIRLQPAPQTSDDLEAILQNCLPQIAARDQPDGVWLDLRSVFPRWDQQLVEGLSKP